jgi:hypothetical protein
MWVLDMSIREILTIDVKDLLWIKRPEAIAKKDAIRNELLSKIGKTEGLQEKLKTGENVVTSEDIRAKLLNTNEAVSWVFVWIPRKNQWATTLSSVGANSVSISTEIQDDWKINPESVNGLDYAWLSKLLNWEIFNPNILKDKQTWISKKITQNPNAATEYKFFVACDIWDTEGLDDSFELASIWDLNKTQWYCLFSCNEMSTIIVPNKARIDFDTQTKIHFNNEMKENIWNLWDWKFQFDKNIWRKIIRCSVSKEDMLRMFTNMYSYAN